MPVCWTGLDEAGYTWEAESSLAEPDNLTNRRLPPGFKALIDAFEQTTSCSLTRCPALSHHYVHSLGQQPETRRSVVANLTSRIQGRGSAARRPGRGQRGAGELDAALLMARQRSLRQHRSSALHARCNLAMHCTDWHCTAAWQTVLHDTLLVLTKPPTAPSQASLSLCASLTSSSSWVTQGLSLAVARALLRQVLPRAPRRPGIPALPVTLRCSGLTPGSSQLPAQSGQGSARLGGLDGHPGRAS